MEKVAKELGIVLIVPIFERQAKGVYRNSAAIIDADGALLGVPAAGIALRAGVAELPRVPVLRSRGSL